MGRRGRIWSLLGGMAIALVAQGAQAQVFDDDGAPPPPWARAYGTARRSSRPAAEAAAAPSPEARAYFLDENLFFLRGRDNARTGHAHH